MWSASQRKTLNETRNLKARQKQSSLLDRRETPRNICNANSSVSLSRIHSPLQLHIVTVVSKHTSSLCNQVTCQSMQQSAIGNCMHLDSQLSLVTPASDNIASTRTVLSVHRLFCSFVFDCSVVGGPVQQCIFSQLSLIMVLLAKAMSSKQFRVANLCLCISIVSDTLQLQDTSNESAVMSTFCKQFRAAKMKKRRQVGVHSMKI